MKKILIFLSFVLVTFSIVSCKKDLEKITIAATPQTGALTALTASTFPLNRDSAAATFQKFTWAKADFGYPASITYILQIDKKANNFSTPYVVTSVANALTSTITVGDFNKILLAMGLTPDAAADIQFRVKAIVSPTATPAYSAVQDINVTPYAVVFPPIYMTGDATGGWGWALYQYKELRSTAPNIYETIGYFVNNGAFRFFKQTDWSPTSWNFPYFTGTVSPLFINASDGDSNFRFTGTTGYYKVTVNMSTKSVSMASVAEPTLFATGAALGGWDWTTNFIKLTWKSNGIYQATTDFINGQAFRFFAQQDWGPTGYNFPYFNGGTVSALFVNAADGDSNFKFIGTTGNFLITVNMLDKIITMVSVPK
jgi:hypothetical protein